MSDLSQAPDIVNGKRPQASSPSASQDLSGSDYADQFRMDQRKQTVNPPPDTGYDLGEKYLMDNDILTPSPGVDVTSPRISLNEASLKTESQEASHQVPDPVDQALVDLNYNNQAWEEKAQVGRDLSKDLLSRARDLRDQGNPAGVIVSIEGVAVRAGVGFYEGLSSVVRPTTWKQTGEMAVGLGQDVGASLGTGVKPSGVSEKIRQSVEMDPLGFVSETAGGLAGGYLTGKLIGELAGPKGSMERISEVDIETGVQDHITGADFTATIEKKSIPAKIAGLRDENGVGLLEPTGPGGARLESDFSGFVGTPEGDLPRGVKVNLPSEEINTLFEKRAGVMDKVRDRLGLNNREYQGKTVFSSEATREVYSPPSESDVGFKVKNSTPLEYESGRRIASNSEVSDIVKGKVGGMKDLKEVGSESVWMDSGEASSPIGETSTGLSDKTRIRVISGISEEAPLSPESEFKPVNPEPGVHTPFSKHFGLEEPKVKPGGEVGGGPPGALKSSLIKEGQASQRALSRFVVEPGISSGASESIGAGAGSVEAMRASIGQGSSPLFKSRPSQGSSSGPLMDNWLGESNRPKFSQALTPDLGTRVKDFNKPISGLRSNQGFDQKFKPFDIIDNKLKNVSDAIQKPIITPVSDYRHKDILDTVQKPITTQDQDQRPVPVITVPGNYTQPLTNFRPPERPIKKSRRRPGIIGLENRHYKIGTPSEILGGLGKRRRIL